MQLSVGDHLGPYEILAPIGAGGMGEVWKARDTRLNRIVAIKKIRGEAVVAAPLWKVVKRFAFGTKVLSLIQRHFHAKTPKEFWRSYSSTLVF